MKGVTVAKVAVKQGAAKFGGTMRMLGGLTTKVCRYRHGGCSLGRNDWRYDAIGVAAPGTNGAGVVTMGYRVSESSVFYHTALGQSSTWLLRGSRFPWTTGSVTVTAARGPHNTVHYAMGYDNRTPVSGKGTIQLVSPVLSHWLAPGMDHETGGIGILRIKFLPEPRAWAVLLSGIAMLVVAYRLHR
ncbi:MAG TPA: hypothetical protein VEC18_02675 [Myxococcota bacterium]|nr:hypothetical protein [Myxococcota bacterium]